MGTKANIVVDKIEGVYTGDVGETLPTITGTLGNSITMTGWDDMGFTEGAAEINPEADIRKVRPNGMEGDLMAFATGVGGTVKVMGLESTLANLQLALSRGTVASDALPDGGAGALPQKALAIVATTKVYHVKAVSTNGKTAIKVDDKNPNMWEMEFDMYVEEAATAGERIYKTHDRTAS